MGKKIKLFVITHSFPTKYNPVAAIFLLNQLEELKKYCDIKVLFPYLYSPKIKALNPYSRHSRMPYEEKIKGIPVYHPKYLMFPRISLVKKFLNIFLPVESYFSYLSSKKTADRIMEGWNPDIIHMHSSLSEGLLGSRLKRKYGKPLFVTVYGEDITLYMGRMLSGKSIKSTLRNSDGIICQSRFLEDEIKKSGIKGEKFHVIPMGARVGQFKPRSKNKLRKTLDLPENKKVVLFVGHLVPRKGVEYLIKAVKLVLEREKGVLCCIIGSGYLESNLKRSASELNLQQYTRFLGQKANDEVAYYMNACDILVLPSLNEGLPVVLCEALACGKPVVATKVAGTPELVNSDVGYLVNPKDVGDLAEKIALALNKKWDRKKLLKRAQEFSAEASAKKLLKVYRSLIKND